MTEHRTVEERISLWLEDEAQGQLPERVLQTSFDQTRALRQRPGSSVWRPFAMSRPIPALIAVGAAAIVVAIGASLVGSARFDQRAGNSPQTIATATTPMNRQSHTTVDLALDLIEGGNILQPVVRVPAPRAREGGSWSGPIGLAISGGTVTGELRLDTRHELERSRTGPVVNHAWGTATGELNGASCEGSLAFSYYSADPGGGTFFLRCDDGTVFGGPITTVNVQPYGESWRLMMTVDGTYVPGAL